MFRCIILDFVEYSARYLIYSCAEKKERRKSQKQNPRHRNYSCRFSDEKRDEAGKQQQQK